MRAVERHLPTARVTGLAVGLHAIVRLGREVDGEALVRAASRRSVGVYLLGYTFMEPRTDDDGLILGYANLTESGIEEGIRRLASALEECARPRPGGPSAIARANRDREGARGPSPTNDGGAIAR